MKHSPHPVSRFKLKPPVILISTLILTSCGGGGGGGGGNGGAPSPTRPSDPAPTATTTPPVPSPTPTPTPAPIPAAPSTPIQNLPQNELGSSSYIAQSGADKAWAAGYTGKGVTVAIVDSGLATGSEFSGRVHAASGNITEDENNNVVIKRPVTDDQNHGTWVASVLGGAANGKNTVGVAPEATLLALGFYSQADIADNGSFWINLDRLTLALSESRAAGAPIVNGSFTIDVDDASVRSALQSSVAAGQLLVFAAGNGGEANPAIPGRYAKEDWAKGQIIAVGAVDANNKITDYSNRAGDALQFYLVARGNLNVTDKDGNMVAVAGTSFAAPQVSGAAALLKQKWPQLTAQNIAGVLFASATDLGDPGVDAVYGPGLLNIDKAMQPIGQPTIATAGGTAAPVSGTSLVLPAGAVASTVARASAQGILTVAAVDGFGRDFRTNLAPRVSQAGSLLYGDLQQGLNRDLYGVDRNLGNLRVSLTPSLQSAGERSILTSRSFFGYGEHSRWQLAGGSTDRLDQFFGLESQSRGQTHPYFRLARDGQFAGTGFALTDNSRFRAGTVSSASAAGQVIDFAYSSRDRFRALPAAGDWSLGLTAGSLAEKGRLLGMAGSGAFAMVPGRSAFTTLGGQYWLDANTELGGSLTLGRTEGSTSGLLQFSPLTAWSAEARLARSNTWTRGDRLTFSIGKPMVISSGTLSLVLPARISDDGQLGFQQTRLGLAGGATETRFGLSYGTDGGKDGKLSLNGIYRLNPDNQPGQREGIFGLQYQRRFD